MSMQSNIARLLLSLVFAFLASALYGKQPEQRPSQVYLDETVKIYCEAWSEIDIDKRLRLLERVWVEERTYTDPVSYAEAAML